MPNYNRAPQFPTSPTPRLRLRHGEMESDDAGVCWRLLTALLVSCSLQGGCLRPSGGASQEIRVQGVPARVDFDDSLLRLQQLSHSTGPGHLGVLAGTVICADHIDSVSITDHM
jgi:hypothetical protein